MYLFFIRQQQREQHAFSTTQQNNTHVML